MKLEISTICKIMNHIPKTYHFNYVIENVQLLLLRLLNQLAQY